MTGDGEKRRPPDGGTALCMGRSWESRTCDQQIIRLDGSVGEVEELLGFAFHFEPNVLMLLVARYPSDPLDEVKDGRRRMALFIEDRIDDLGGLTL